MYCLPQTRPWTTLRPCCRRSWPWYTFAVNSNRRDATCTTWGPLGSLSPNRSWTSTTRTCHPCPESSWRCCPLLRRHCLPLRPLSNRSSAMKWVNSLLNAGRQTLRVRPHNRNINLQISSSNRWRWMPHRRRHRNPLRRLPRHQCRRLRPQTLPSWSSWAPPWAWPCCPSRADDHVCRAFWLASWLVFWRPSATRVDYTRCEISWGGFVKTYIHLK